MEEDRAAAYYDELARKGEGAARFKQGLGFSSSASGNEAVPARGSGIPSSTSVFSQFVRASSPSSAAKLEKDSEIRSIRDKLKKKPEDKQLPRVPERKYRESSDWCRSRSRERDGRERRHRRRSRSRSKERDDRDRRQRRRSRSRSRERRREREKEKDLNGDRERRRRRRRRRSRSSSPRDRRRSDDERRGGRREEVKEGRNVKVDYSRLIKGYDEMSAAERVKAKMKLQLAETAEKDKTMGAGWERFEFDKDAPVNDEEVEVTDDDAGLVKRMGQSFRFSAIEARREEQIKAAHEEAMFGAPTHTISAITEDDKETSSVKHDVGESNTGNSLAATSLLSEKVLAKQQGSWRDRARKS